MYLDAVTAQNREGQTSGQTAAAPASGRDAFSLYLQQARQRLGTGGMATATASSWMFSPAHEPAEPRREVEEPRVAERPARKPQPPRNERAEAARNASHRAEERPASPERPPEKAEAASTEKVAKAEKRAKNEPSAEAKDEATTAPAEGAVGDGAVQPQAQTQQPAAAAAPPPAAGGTPPQETAAETPDSVANGKAKAAQAGPTTELPPEGETGEKPKAAKQDAPAPSVELPEQASAKAEQAVGRAQAMAAQGGKPPQDVPAEIARQVPAGETVSVSVTVADRPTDAKTGAPAARNLSPAASVVQETSGAATPPAQPEGATDGENGSPFSSSRDGQPNGNAQNAPGITRAADRLAANGALENAAQSAGKPIEAPSFTAALSAQVQAQSQAAAQQAARQAGGQAAFGQDLAKPATPAPIASVTGGAPAGQAGPTAASHAAPPRPVAHPSPVDQVAVQLQKAAQSGQDSVSIKLRPASLGNIEVRLDFRDGHVTATVTADRPETLDMLKQDARGLEKALNDAGLQTDAGSLNFNLRGERGGQGGERQTAGQPDGRGQQGKDGPGSPNADTASDQTQHRPQGRPGGIDIRV